MKTDVLVIGAGISGLAAATKVAQAGYSVTLVEKARGSGGRLSSKRLSHEGKDYSFDLGCTHISTTTPEFKHALSEWTQAGSVMPFGDSDDLFLGSPRNSSITRHLANKLDAHFSTRITALEETRNGWNAYTEKNVNGRDQTDLFCQAKWLILSAPAEQSFNLLPVQHPLRPALSCMHIKPSWVLLAVVESDEPIEQIPETIYPIKSISLECRKRNPNSTQQIYCIQIQADEQWSQEHIDDGLDNIAGNLIGTLKDSIQAPFKVKTHHVHRWLYAQADHNNPVHQNTFLRHERLGVCGDYLGMSRSTFGVEAAYLSGASLAEEIIQLNSTVDQVAEAIL